MEKVYVCGICGHVVFGAPSGACPVCHSPIDKIVEAAEGVKTADKEGKEKHVPVIAITKTCGLIPGTCEDVHIKVGSVPHPMTAEHAIQWIDVYVNKVYMARYSMSPLALQAAIGIHLKAGQAGTLTVTEHCNLHGTWMAEAAL